jgi:hypothetical protein
VGGIGGRGGAGISASDSVTIFNTGTIRGGNGGVAGAGGAGGQWEPRERAAQAVPVGWEVWRGHLEMVGMVVQVMLQIRTVGMGAREATPGLQALVERVAREHRARQMVPQELLPRRFPVWLATEGTAVQVSTPPPPGWRVAMGVRGGMVGCAAMGGWAVTVAPGLLARRVWQEPRRVTTAGLARRAALAELGAQAGKGG